MSETELLTDILNTKVELDDIIEAHKFAENSEQKRHLKTAYAQKLNSYLCRQNNYRVLISFVEYKQ